MAWTVADIPDLRGRSAVVTGANSGIGLETAAALAGAGATVVLACRNLEKAKVALADIEARHTGASVELLALDLADQSQIARAAEEARARFPQIDVLVNNAGVMALPFCRTADGFEMVFGTNHLGHFAFTGRLVPALLAAPHARVVTVSSMSHRLGRIRWDHLDDERGYNKPRAYAQSKLANMLFAFELQRRFARAGVAAMSLAAHPGFANTEIGRSNALSEGSSRFAEASARFVPTAAEAARPSLRAATSPDAYGGQYYGPAGRGGVKGPPVVVPPARRVFDEEDQARLWALSVQRTGVDFELP
jgi:NAD(P)-dependent dehydrogenase (short-subunit alcohol dehydrogenase family)